MALQGNLDTFALPDVLRLLASTKKSGCLHVGGTRGTGSVWVDEGKVVAAEATGTSLPCTPLDVVFELLRYADGTFAFESESPPAPIDEALDLEELLSEVEGLFEEWTGIEAVVPSMDHWVSLVVELGPEEITIDASAWRTVVAIGSGGPVRAVAQTMGLGEVQACRALRDAVEAGLAVMSDAAPVPDVPAPFVPAVAAAPTAPAAPAAPPVYEDATEFEAFEIELPPIKLPDETLPPPPPPAPAWRFDPFEESWADTAEHAIEEPVAEEPVAAPPAAEDAVTEPDHAPLPAEDAATDDAPAAAEEPVEEAPEAPIDRGRLLRFLGSVRS